MVPGFMPIVPSDKFTTLSYFAEASASSGTTITAPAGIKGGDLIVLLDYAGSAPDETLPSGFTQAVKTSDGSNCFIGSYRIANGSEGGTSITGQSGFTVAKIMFVFRGNFAISGVTSTSFTGQITSGNPSPINVTASGGTAPLVIFGSYLVGLGFGLSGVTFSPAQDGTVSITDCEGRYKIYNSSPANTSIDQADSGGINVLNAFYLSVT